MRRALCMKCGSLGRKGALPPALSSFKPWSNHGARMASIGRGLGRPCAVRRSDAARTRLWALKRAMLDSQQTALSLGCGRASMRPPAPGLMPGSL